MLTTITPQKIASLCESFQVKMSIEVVTQTESTNTDLLSRVTALTEPTVLIAERQTGGRGRAGRTWQSAPGVALTFSLAWPFSGSVQALSGLSLAIGVAIVEGLQDFDVRTELKWPNDVLKDGKKLGGILVEITKAGQHTWAVIGVGLNLLLPEEIERQIGQPVASAPWLAQMNHNELIAGLLNRLFSVLNQFSRKGFAPFVPLWNSYHAHQGRLVTLFDAERFLYEGIAVGVDSNGCLLLDTIGGRIPVSAGDVSLRTKE